MKDAETHLRGMRLLERGLKLPGVWLAQLLARNSLGWRFMFWVRTMRSATPDHPIDLAYGIHTAGTLPPFLIAPKVKLNGEIMPHGGCQPSCLRRAIESIPDTTSSTFYDLGCGKGRALVVASEFQFQNIIGVDISGWLCAIARENAMTIRGSYPDRTEIAVHQGDAAEIEFPNGALVVFLYHAFGRKTLSTVIGKLESAARTNKVAIVYENPVNGDLIDASHIFVRWFGAQVPREPEEREHHADRGEAIVVWRSWHAELIGEGRPAEFDIVVTKPGWRAEIVHR